MYCDLSYNIPLPHSSQQKPNQEQAAQTMNTVVSLLMIVMEITLLYMSAMDECPAIVQRRHPSSSQKQSQRVACWQPYHN